MAPSVGVERRGHLDSLQTVRFSVELPAGTYIHFSVQQEGVDLIAIASDAEGRNAIRTDSPVGSLGVEPVSYCSTTPGAHVLSLSSSAEEIGGAYQVTIDTLRPASLADVRHCAAVRETATADALRRQGGEPRLRQAAERYRSAIRALETMEGGLREEVIARRRLAQTEQARGEAHAAKRTLLAALPRAHRLGDAAAEAGLWIEMGRTEQLLGDYGAVERAQRVALTVSCNGKAPHEEALAWHDFAEDHYRLSHLRLALEGFYRAQLAYHRLGRRRSESVALYSLSMLLLDLYRVEEAGDALERSIALDRALDPTEGGSAHKLALLSRVYAERGEAARAVSLARSAARQARRSGSPEVLAWVEASSMGSYLSVNLPDHALALGEKSIDAFRQHKNFELLASSLVSVGLVLESLGHDDPARHRLTEGLSISQRLGNRRDEALAHFGLAKLERRSHHLQAAREHLALAVGQLETLRRSAPDTAWRRSFFAARQPYFESYVDVLMSLEEVQPGERWAGAALSVSERSRARSFLDTLEVLGTAQESESAKARETRDRELLARLVDLDQARPQAVDRANLEIQIRDLLSERAALLSNSKSDPTEPRGRLGRHFAGPMEVRAIQRYILDRDSSLLIYQLGETRSYLWLVEHDRLKAFRLSGRAVLEGMARSAHASLKSGPGGAIQRTLVLRRLADEILKPAASQLKHLRLLIVPDGALRLVPFSALPDPAIGQPLVTQHEIIVLDSPSVLHQMRLRRMGRPRAMKTVAVVSDPVFSSHDERVRLTSSQNSLRLPSVGAASRNTAAPDFPRLPESKREAEAILALVPPSKSLSLKDFGANRSAVLAGRLRGFKIVHFATHGVVNAEHPELSGLLLSQVDEQGQPREGFLRAFEIQRLGLDADLVVLGSCRSALGQLEAGEGIVGLTRSFIEAGAPRLVVSLWPVEDRSTAELMSRFYENLLRRHERPAAALRAAQIGMLSDPAWSDPMQWAGFFFTGDWK